jgi:hypothetical protein
MIGMSTALQLFRDTKAEGLIFSEDDPNDGRATLISPTAKLIDRAELRWERLAAATRPQILDASRLRSALGPA